MDEFLKLFESTSEAIVFRLELILRTVIVIAAVTLTTTVLALGISWVFEIQFHLFFLAMAYLVLFGYAIYRNYPGRIFELLLGIDMALDLAERPVTLVESRSDGTKQEFGNINWPRTENLTTARRYLRLLFNLAAVQIFLLMFFAWVPVWVFPLKIAGTFFLASGLLWYLHSKVGMDSALIPWLRPIVYVFFIGALVAMFGYYGYSQVSVIKTASDRIVGFHHFPWILILGMFGAAYFVSGFLKTEKKEDKK